MIFFSGWQLTKSNWRLKNNILILALFMFQCTHTTLSHPQHTIFECNHCLLSHLNLKFYDRHRKKTMNLRSKTSVPVYPVGASGIEYCDLIERWRREEKNMWHLNIHIRFSMEYFIPIKIRCSFVGHEFGSGSCSCVFFFFRCETILKWHNYTPWMSWFCIMHCFF